jgi:hypothetical protein
LNLNLAKEVIIKTTAQFNHNTATSARTNELFFFMNNAVKTKSSSLLLLLLLLLLHRLSSYSVPASSRHLCLGIMELTFPSGLYFNILCGIYSSCILTTWDNYMIYILQ